MAYVQDANDPNAQQPATTPGAAMNQLPVTSSGAGAGATSTNTSAGGSPQGAAAVPNSTQAPPVQNLQAYLTANQPQAVQMGQNIVSGLTNQAGQVSGDINADQAAIDAQVQAQNTPVNQDLINQAAANPAQFVKDPIEVAQFLGQENAAYTGPSTFESTQDYQTLTNEVTNAQQNAPDINTSAGVNQLVRGQETNPTLGMSNLDQLLLQGTPEAMSPIAAAEAPIANLGTQLSGATTTEDAAIQAAIANDQAAPAAVNSAFLTGPNAVVPTWENALNQEVQGAAGNYANDGSLINALTSAMNNGDLSQLNPAQLSQLGLTPAQVSQLMTAKNDLQPIGASAPSLTTAYTAGTINPNAPTSATVATPQDYAMESALQQLLGSSFANGPLNASQSNEAGTYNPVGTNPSFNSSGYATDLANTGIPKVTPSWANLGSDTLAQKLQFLDVIAGIAPTQQPGQYDYQNPQQIAFENALKAMQGGLLPSNPGY